MLLVRRELKSVSSPMIRTMNPNTPNTQHETPATNVGSMRGGPSIPMVKYMDSAMIVTSAVWKRLASTARDKKARRDWVPSSTSR